MGWMGLAAALPILFLFGLALVRPWTDRKGWTKTRGAGTRTADHGPAGLEPGGEP